MSIHRSDEIPHATLRDEPKRTEQTFDWLTILTALVRNREFAFQPQRFLQQGKKRHSLFAS